MSSNLSVLVVDDDPVIRRLLRERLKAEDDYAVQTAESGYMASDLIKQRIYDIVLTDLIMPGDIGGLEVLEIAKKRCQDTEVILITAHSSVDTAVEAMKNGAFDYLEKPINFEELFLRINKIANMRKLLKSAQDLDLAMRTTEGAASSTIQSLEVQIVNLQDIHRAVSLIVNDTTLSAEEKIVRIQSILATNQ